MDAPDAQQADFENLRGWLAGLPTQIDYDPEGGAVSRQAFLAKLCASIAPDVAAAVYLQDRGEKRTFLTLAYASGLQGHPIEPPQRIEPKSAAADGGAVAFDDVGLWRFAAEAGFDELESVVLTDTGQANNELLLRPEDLGAGIIFLPDKSLLNSLVNTKLRIAWRLFAIETSRSRYRRRSLATEAMLRAINESATKDDFCEILNLYCRSHFVCLLERSGAAYSVVAKSKTTAKAPKAAVQIALPRQIKSTDPLRSHTFDGPLSKSLQAIIAGSAWMILPCFTDGANIESATDVKHPEYVLLFVGKENTEYLGGDFSLTDLSIAQVLVALLATHLPNMGLSEAFGELHGELGNRQLTGLDLPWYFNLARRFLPSLDSVGLFLDLSSQDTARCFPNSFEPLEDTLRHSKSPRPFEACSGLVQSGEAVQCLVFPLATELRVHQKIVFAFTDKVIPEAQMQLLNILVEYAKSEIGITDFREHHISTQAQIRHVIRGALSAAISEIELVESRFAMYANLPTKLARLLDTPTMRDGMTDTLLWLNEAFALVEAPRYLLESLDSASVRWGDVAPVAIIRSVLHITRAEMRRRDVRVEFTPTSDDEEHLVSCDQEFLKIVIFNLVDNAIKYSYSGRFVRIELIFKELTWRLEVENFGVPIKKADQERIFEPFARSVGNFLSYRRPGTGLGLAVSKRILQAHDDSMVFGCSSDIFQRSPQLARTTFFFELGLKGKGGTGQ